MRTKKIFLLLAFVLTLLSGASPTKAIYNGSLTNFPPVGYVDLFGTLCSGTLIAPRLVLTAGHCFYGFPQNKASLVEFGMLLPGQIPGRTENVRVFNVRDFEVLGNALIIGNWAAGGPDDIALIMLTEDVPSTLASPIPITTQVLSQGTQVAAFGWGQTCPYSNCPGGTQHGISYLLGQSVTCQGDSGGPILWNGKIYGVISGGYCGSRGQRQIDADPARFYDHIARRIAENGGAPLCSSSISPATNGTLNTVFNASLNGVGGTSCYYTVIGGGRSAPIPCNFSGPIFNGSDPGVGEGSKVLHFTVQNAAGTRYCDSPFEVRSTPSAPLTKVSPEVSFVPPGANVTFNTQMQGISFADPKPTYTWSGGISLIRERVFAFASALFPYDWPSR